VTARCCSGCRAAWIRPWSRRCCIAPSATSSPACSSTPACCVQEGDQVMAMFAAAHGREGDSRECGDRFLRAAQAGVDDPEAKRKIIGRLFIEVFEEEAAKLSGVKWLAQGTIYPDVIESAGSKTGKAHVIKSHHNVGGLPAHMKLKPGRAAARAVQGRGAPHRRGTRPAARDGLPASVPRPGPRRAHPRRGQAGIRRLLRAPMHIFIEELHTAGLVRQGQPGLCRVPAGEVGGRGG
jgi:GMP synthase (glutamine-hydrolysing)